MKVFKYPLTITGKQSINLPAGAKILTVQVQKGDPYLWALVNEQTVLTEAKIIHTYGTGHVVTGPVKSSYIGTYQIHEGDLVFHVFEEIP